MPDDSLRSAIDAVARRLHEELEAQLNQLDARQREAVESARHAAEADAEQRWSAKLDGLREEWTARLQSEVDEARAEAERRMAAEAARLRAEGEQAVADATARARDELGQELERTRAEAERRLADETTRLRAEGEEAARQAAAHVREELERELQHARAEAEQRIADESARLRAEGEQAAADAGHRVRQELEHAVAQANAEADRRMADEAARLRLEGEQAAADAAARVRDELERVLQQANAEAEQRIAEESARSRGETARAAAETEARVREELERGLEQALAQERERAAAQLAAERQQFATFRAEMQRDLDRSAREILALRQQIDGLLAARNEAEAALAQERRARADEARQQEQQAADLADARVSERQSQLAIVERLLAAMRTMDAARSLSDVLAALLTAAAAEAPRVALFVVNGAALRGWKATGFDSPVGSLQVSLPDAGLLGEVVRRAEVATAAEGEGPSAPAFANLPAGRAAIAVPLVVGAQPVAVLYADDGVDEAGEAPASWPEAIQMLGRHASVNLAHLTAARAAEAMRKSLVPQGTGGPAPSPAKSAKPAAPEDGNSARRYARLLVSEIKLYNEAAVRIGREKHDLLVRLKPEIERARKLYEQRISPAVDARASLFHQELVQTLADGDPALLGGPA